RTFGRMRKRRHDFFSTFSRNEGAQFFDASATDIGDAAEFSQESLSRSWPDSGDFAERALRLPFAAALAVKGDREAVCLIANLLNEVQHRRMVVQDDGFVFLAEDIKYLLFLRDAGHRLIDDLERFERLSRSMQLADAAVDEDEAGQFLFFFEHTAV